MNALSLSSMQSQFQPIATPNLNVGKKTEKTNQAIEDTAQDFEAMFLSEMFKHMFQGVKTDSTFGGGHAEDMYRGLMINEYGKEVAKHGGLGIAENVSRTLLALQENAA